MHIRSKPLAVSSKAVLGLVSSFGAVAMFTRYGDQAWRIFSTWVFLLGALYFFAAGIALLVSKRDSGRIICPMLDGMILTGLVLSGFMRLVYPTASTYSDQLDSWLAILFYIVLPILILLDWLVLAKKGRWRLSEPFYWLALPFTYAATMIFTAEFMPDSAAFRYPLFFLDFQVFSLGNMFGWLLFLGILDLSFGYFLIVIDALMGGKISRHIVLPRIKTVLVEDTPKNDNTEDVEPTRRTNRKRLKTNKN